MPRQDLITDATDLTAAIFTGRNGSGSREFPIALLTPAALGAAPATTPTVAITGATTLVAATHQGKELLCDGAHTLTINGSTDFTSHGRCLVYANAAGTVTIAASGATLNVPSGLTAVINGWGAAEIRQVGTDAYAITGDLVAA